MLANSLSLLLKYMLSNNFKIMLKPTKSMGWRLVQIVRGNRRFSRRVIIRPHPVWRSSEVLKLALDWSFDHFCQRDARLDDQINESLCHQKWKVSFPAEGDQIEMSKLVDQHWIKVVFRPQLKKGPSNLEYAYFMMGKNAVYPPSHWVIRCLITVDKGREKKMLIDCELVDCRINIRSVMVGEKVESIVAERFTRNSHYKGPSFKSLTKPMQDNLEDYIRSLGIETEFEYLAICLTRHHQLQETSHFLQIFRQFLN